MAENNVEMIELIIKTTKDKKSVKIKADAAIDEVSFLVNIPRYYFKVRMVILSR